MRNLISEKFLLGLLLCLGALLLFPEKAVGQENNSEHQLLWRISGNGLSTDSYIYGTMHLRDERVFHLPDSIYMKMESCAYFALEVHPDTITKHLIVNPFNRAVNLSMEEEFSLSEELDSESLDAINEELKNRNGISLDDVNTKDPVLIDLLLDKFFKKNKEKRTSLDAHLYHIARVLDKKVIGLESLEDRRQADIYRYKNSLDFSDSLDIPPPPPLLLQRMFKTKYQEEMIGLYQKGNIKEIFNQYGYKSDSSLAYRNRVMVKSSIPYFSEGGLFMAVGAAHLAGDTGILSLLEQKGYTVEPVKAIFSGIAKNSSLIDKELPWVPVNNSDEGYSFSMPDQPYEYRPESIGGVIKMGIYPDMGTGHHYYTLAVPLVTDTMNIDDAIEIILERLETNYPTMSAKLLENITVNGVEGKGLEYMIDKGFHYRFYYVINNNYLYTFGFGATSKKELASSDAERFFSSVSFNDMEENNNLIPFVHKDGAYSIKSYGTPQQYSQSERADDFSSDIINLHYATFYAPNKNMFFIVVYGDYSPGLVLADKVEMFEDYSELFLDADFDSLVYEKEYARLGGKDVLILDDQTFLRAVGFARGNRFYQILATGPNNETTTTLTDDVIESFKLTPYQPKTWNAYSNAEENVTFELPGKIDSLSETFNYKSYAFDGYLSSNEYRALDKGSSANFSIEELKLSPYKTHGSLENLLNSADDYKSWKDTIINKKLVVHKGAQSMRFEIESPDNDLYTTKLVIPWADKLYTLSVIEDKNAREPEAVDQFFNSLTITKPIGSPLLLRDSVLVKQRLFDDLNSQDSSVFFPALTAISDFTYTDEELEKLIKVYDSAENKDSLTKDMVYSNLTLTLGENLNESVSGAFKTAYLSASDTSYLRKDILNQIIRQKKKSNILEAKALLIESPYNPTKEWLFNSAFSGLNDSIEFLPYFFPEMVDWVQQDSSIYLTHLIAEGLEKNLLQPEELRALEAPLLKRVSKSLKSLEGDKDGERWSAKYSMQEAARILSYFPISETAKKAYITLLNDSSVNYKIYGIEYCLRSGVSFDLSAEKGKIMDDKSELLELYRLDQLFPSKSILGNNDKTSQKYGEAYIYSYLTDEDYLLIKSMELEDVVVENGKQIMFFKLEAEDNYYHEDDREQYWINVLFAVDDDQGEFSIPDASGIYINYEYLEGENDESVKRSLFDMYRAELDTD